MRYLMIAPLVFLLAACTGLSPEYKAFLDAHRALTEKQIDNQKPMVEIEAADGKPITGLKSLRVYGPMQPVRVEQQRPNEWAGVATATINGVTQIGTIREAGRAAIGLAKTAGKNAGGNIYDSYNVEENNPVNYSADTTSTSTSTSSVAETTTNNTTSTTNTTTSTTNSQATTGSYNNDSTHVPNLYYDGTTWQVSD